MKFLPVLAAAAILATAGATVASAARLGDDAFVDRADTYVQPSAEHPYDRCHGRASGTASAACGTLTGGPSGSLF